MKDRLISAILIITIMAVLIFLSSVPFVLNTAVALLSAAALYEVLIITKYVESKTLMAISLILAFIIPFINVILFAIPVRYLISTALIGCIFAYTLFVFMSLLFSSEKFSLEHLSVVFLMSIIIPCFFSTIVYSHALEGGTLNLVLIFMCAWGADSGGYVFGRLFGRHKLTPKISPKKTVEGFIGGLMSSTSGILIVSFIADTINEALSVNYIAVVVYGIIGGCCAVLGDLFASVIKRSFNVKDFGKLIPGHGGIMDRFDSVLFTAPFLYVAITIVPVFVSTVA